MEKIVNIIKGFVILFILAGFVIAGLNFGVEDASQEFKDIMHLIYVHFEYSFRTLLVIVCGILVLRFYRNRKKVQKMRRNSIIAFSIFMLITLVIIPLFNNNFHTYLMLMPFPWNSIPVQLIKKGQFLHYDWSSSYIFFMITLYFIYNGVIIIGTLIYGRRVQCSWLCLMFGGHAETFSPALPLLKTKEKKSKSISPGKLKFLIITKWLFLIINLLIMFFMAIDLFDIDLLRDIEGYKYLALELVLVQLLYFTFNGRAYCYYCPAGTAVSLVARISGQEIETNLTKCIDCKLCDKDCEMSINISSRAVKGISVNDLNCVGCGHCVDVCPTDNLRYSTGIIRKIISKKR